MDKETLPLVSVAICTFNRADCLNPCLESLRKQTYPRDRYEIIVVDDGSTDATLQMVQTEGVRLIRHEKNKGIPAARNTAIAAAKGEIIAFIDDDAIADPDWLKYLIEPFSNPKISGSGGKTFAYKTDHIAERYLAAEEYGMPAPLAFGKSKNPLWRFWVYLKNMFTSVGVADQPTEVQAVFGLNCAYRASAFKDFGGFDESLLGDEDSELAVRLRSHGLRIMYMPKAVIHHRHRESVVRLIKQTYYRTESTFHAYKKEKKSLPIFPLPLFYLLVAIVLLVVQPVISLVFIILGPLVIYSWWLVRSLREKNPEYCVYAYIQLALEIAAILGLARGKFRSIIKAH